MHGSEWGVANGGTSTDDAHTVTLGLTRVLSRVIFNPR